MRKIERATRLTLGRALRAVVPLLALTALALILPAGADSSVYVTDGADIVKYDADGNHVWTANFDGAICALSVDALGTVYPTGIDAAGACVTATYRVPGPQVVSVHPLPEAVAPVTTTVEAKFSEPMDPETVTTGSLFVSRFVGLKSIAAGYGFAVALKGDGTVAAWRSGSAGEISEYGQTDVPVGLSDVVAISPGTLHTLALKNDGSVVAWGLNDAGQTDVPPGLSGVTAIAAATDHSVALKNDGTVVVWGHYGGASDAPEGLSGVTAVATGFDHNVALKSDGTVVAWGDNLYGESNVPEGLWGVTAITAGTYHTVALKSDGTVAAWGDNSCGQTNVPAGLSDVAAIAAAQNHTVALKSNGTVVVWGCGQAPEGLSDVAEILGAGPNPTVVLKSDGSYASWGGDAANWHAMSEGLSGVTAIAASSFGTLCLRNDGTVVAWGPLDVPEGLSGVMAIAAGYSHGVGLRNDGTLVAWGDNGYGQATVPAGLSGVTAIAAGGWGDTVALKSDGTVVAWGWNEYGQTSVPEGLSEVTAISAGLYHTAALKADGTVVLWGDDSYGQTEVPEGLSGVRAIAAGAIHTVALKDDGTVVAWGSNMFGQTDVPEGLSEVTAIAAGGWGHTVALKSDGTVVAWGWNEYGQTSVPEGLSGVIAVAAGEVHTVALKADGTLVAWGDPAYVPPLGTVYDSRIPGSVSYDPAIAKATFTPSSPLAEGTTYQVTVAGVRSEAGVPLSPSIHWSFTTPRGPNRPPVFNTIGNKMVSEGSTLSFLVTATDPDGDALVYSAGNLPPGAAFNPATRVFTWTPGIGQAGAYENIVFTVTDNGSPPANASETITITLTADLCPSDPMKTAPGVCGCGLPDTDTDGDGVADCLDACPSDPLKTTSAGACGCGVPDTDSDGDGVPNCLDVCPSDPLKTTSAGACGCGVPDTDTDGDGVADCLDVCPSDPLKTTSAGACGCGVVDTDTDGDGVADCLDACPSDPLKFISAGICGCSVSDLDRDGDHVPDCRDACPNDPLKYQDGDRCGRPAPFTRTNPMTSMRNAHTATLLPDGKVLIAGGYYWDEVSRKFMYLNTAELYDPATRTFRAITAHMTAARNGHRAVLLMNGKVLLVGGWSSSTTASAEVYDPASETFTATKRSMNYRRGGHTATLLPDGRVLVAGGWGYSTITNTAEIYDSETDTFTITGRMTASRGSHDASLLHTGKVLLVGGQNLNSAEVYDPVTGVFTSTSGNMTIQRYDANISSVLPNGTVLVAGGNNSSDYSSTAEIFDPSTGTFTSTGNMTTSRSVFTSTPLTNGKVLIVGGSTYTAEVYDSTTGTFTAVAAHTTALRTGHTATLLLDGTVLISGGIDSDARATAEIYEEPPPNQPPGAAAGADQTVHSGVSVRLDGSGSYDPDGDYPLGYAWVLAAKPAGSTTELSGADGLSATLVPDKAGEYQIRLFVTDSYGLKSSPSEVVIRVTNEVPVAEAGPDQEVDEGAHVILDGTGSHDSDGDALTFQWAQTAGPAVTMDLTDPARPRFLAPAVPRGGATLIFQLNVTDGLETFGDAVSIHVGNLDLPPAANAGADQVVDEKTRVTLDGSGSSEPDGEPVSYHWEQTGGPQVVLEGADTARPTFVAPDVSREDAKLAFELTVSDGQLSGGDVVEITVRNVNEPPAAEAGPDQSVDEGTAVFLDGSATVDPDGDPLALTWVQVAGTPVILDAADALHPTFVAPPVPAGGETLTFQLTADDGLASSADTVNVTVRNVNHPPVADAGDPLSVKEGAPVTLTGVHSYDPDGEPLTYAWNQTAGTPVVLADPTAVDATFAAPAVGRAGETLVFSLTVNDGIDNSPPSEVRIRVEDVNHAPIARAGADQTKNEGGVVNLDGSGTTEPDGDAVAFSWAQVSGPTVVLSEPSGPRPYFTAPLVGEGGATLVFRLTADDDLGATASDEVTINVLNINDPPRCGLAQPGTASLWPANHKLVPLQVVGITDPDNSDFAIEVTGVTQDEPIDGLGDGDTSPDAVIQSSGLLLRAERSGTGNGRVYRVSFRAMDAFGESCVGAVTVCVPHHRKDSCVDGGQSYQSTQP